MKLYISIAAVSLFICVPIWAISGPDSDQLGLYFDSTGETVCKTVEIGAPFTMYLIMKEITGQGVQGLEYSQCAVVRGGSPGDVFRLGSNWTGLCSPPFDLTDPCDVGRVFGCVVPVIPTGGDLVVAEFSYIILNDVEVDFYLGPSSVESIDDGLPAYVDGQSVISLGVSSGDPSLPVASVTGDCHVVAVERATFGNIKVRYR